MSFPFDLFSHSLNHAIGQNTARGILLTPITTATTTPTGMGLGQISSIAYLIPNRYFNMNVAENICPNCGTVAKTGALSCCAPGGSWNKKCGNPGDANFEYTWSQGIQACKYLASRAQKQFTSSFQTTISHEFGDGQRFKNTYSTGSVDNDAASPRAGHMISHTLTFISLLFITLHV